MSETMTAIIAKGVNGRVYLSPTDDISKPSLRNLLGDQGAHLSEQSMSVSSLQNYGITQWHQIFHTTSVDYIGYFQRSPTRGS